MAIKTITVDGTTYDINDARITSLPLPIEQGGTGATTIATAKTALGITNYYPTTWTWTAGGANGPTASITGTGMSAVSVAAIPSAGASASGIVTTGAQTFAGNKTFATNVYFANGTTYNVSSTGSGTFNSVDVKGNLTMNQRLVGRYTTTVNTTTSVQTNTIFSGIPTAAGITNQIAFVIVS